MKTKLSSAILVHAEHEGVDLSLLRERLKLTPTERLQRHEAALELVEALRKAGGQQSHAPGQAASFRAP